LPASSAATHGSALGTTYAQALLELADEAGQMETIGDEVRQLTGLIESQDALRLLLGGQLLTAQERRGVVEQIFRGRVSDLLYRFLQVLAAKNRLAQLPQIARSLPHLIEQRQGVQEVEVSAAKSLTDQEAGQIAESLGRVLGKKVVLRQQVDESLVGGLKLRIGDRLLDGSVAAQLRMLRQHLAGKGREDARERLGELVREAN
jgi:F-type H+-transporting ATPase subunit delta